MGAGIPQSQTAECTKEGGTLVGAGAGAEDSEQRDWGRWGRGRDASPRRAPVGLREQKRQIPAPTAAPGSRTGLCSEKAAAGPPSSRRGGHHPRPRPTPGLPGWGRGGETLGSPPPPPQRSSAGIESWEAGRLHPLTSSRDFQIPPQRAEVPWGYFKGCCWRWGGWTGPGNCRVQVPGQGVATGGQEPRAGMRAHRRSRGLGTGKG